MNRSTVAAGHRELSNIARIVFSLPGAHLRRISSRTSLHTGAGGSANLLFR
jgi:hypothetical protein